MRLPGWLDLFVLVLAAFRLTRLVGWDEWPPILRARAWLLGELDIDNGDRVMGGPEPDYVAPLEATYRRPRVAHLVHCPFCLGWWISLAVYTAWLAVPRATLYVMLPFAISGAVGLVAKNLDP